MHNFLAEHGGYTSTIGEVIWRTSYMLESQGCQITVTDLEERKNAPNLRSYTDVYKFSLSDLDPTTIKTEKDPPAVSATARDKRSLVHKYEDGKDYPGWGISLEFYGADDAERFAKALHRAVTLCGGKPSTF
jgi:hypothetical protein